MRQFVLQQDPSPSRKRGVWWAKGKFHNGVSCPVCGTQTTVGCDRDDFMLNCKGCRQTIDVKLVTTTEYAEPEFT